MDGAAAPIARPAPAPSRNSRRDSVFMAVSIMLLETQGSPSDHVPAFVHLALRRRIVCVSRRKASRAEAVTSADSTALVHLSDARGGGRQQGRQVPAVRDDPRARAAGARLELPCAWRGHGGCRARMPDLR